MKRLSLLSILTGILFVSSSPLLLAYPCGGWGGGPGPGPGGWGGSCGPGGWYNTGIPNGLGWTMVGLGAAAVAATTAYAVTAPPVYYTPAPVYPSVSYYDPPQTVVVEKQRTVVREKAAAPQSELLAKVQAKLSALGYYKGNIDGNYGSQTELAVTKFQGENGLPMTGRVDLKTLSSLGISL